MKMNTHSFTDRFLIGEVDKEKIYLSAPSWDCDWYWGFGYLGNNNCHYHIDGLDKNTHMFDALKNHFGDSLRIKDDNNLWTFCELMQTFYTLKETARVLKLGGSHYTSNPISSIIKNEEEAERINKVVMPAIFNAIKAIL